jgi:hypothetical protein
MRGGFGRWLARLGSAAAVSLVAACGGSGDGAATGPGVSGQGMGTLRVALTDAPRCRVGNADLERVYVTVERVRVHRVAEAEPGQNGWTDVAVSPAKKINLLDLTNGRLEELGSARLPAGTYSQVRLVLSANASGGVPANSVIRAGETAEIPLRTPSAAQGGLKIVRPFTVEADKLADLVIDFDACRSIVPLGEGAGGYLLKPVLSASLRTDAAIVGFVDPALDLKSVTVSAQKDGKVVRSTIPSSTGEFALAYLDPTDYVVVITAADVGTAVVAGVAATTAAVTRLSTAADPIRLPAPGSPAARHAGGTLGPEAARATGVVRALQAVGSVPVVEVATVNVDGMTGAFALRLPTAAPRLAAYSATLPLAFATPASPPADFGYTLQASATGYATQSQPIGGGTADATWNPVLVAAP